MSIEETLEDMYEEELRFVETEPLADSTIEVTILPSSNRMIVETWAIDGTVYMQLYDEKRSKIGTPRVISTGPAGI